MVPAAVEVNVPELAIVMPPVPPAVHVPFRVTFAQVRLIPLAPLVATAPLHVVVPLPAV